MEKSKGLDLNFSQKFKMVLLNWFQPSMKILEEAEKEILSIVKTPYEGEFVDIGPHLGGTEECKIWTISLNKDSKKLPLLLVHGLGSGVALWALSLDTLATDRPVYCIDILGLGRSSRPKFSPDGPTAETELIDSIEKWRIKMNLEKFIICGHSYGGYLSTCYALKYPKGISHLILEDPFGFPEKPKENLPFWLPALKLITPFNPYSSLRLSGPLGPTVIHYVRYDVVKAFHQYFYNSPEKSNCISNYIYHSNAQNPTGETVFHSLQDTFGWAKYPLVNRLHTLLHSVPLTMIYGSKSWIHNCRPTKIREIRNGAYADIQVVKGVGHEIHIGNKDAFDEIVLKACKLADSQEI